MIAEHPASVMLPAMVAVVAVTAELTLVLTVAAVLMPAPVAEMVKPVIPPPLTEILPL